MKRHVVLVGLPGSGKSTVGRLAAERLGADFVDVDALIVRRMQMPVARIFAEFGEPRFRELEREAMDALLKADPAVLAPGGGWAVQPGALDASRPRAFVVFLRTPFATAASRVVDAEDRPLLLPNPLERMRRLAAEREPVYERADAEVRNDPPRTAAQAADDVVALARARAGW